MSARYLTDTVVKALEKRPGQTVRDVANRLKAKRSATQSALSSLFRQGRVKRKKGKHSNRFEYSVA